MMERLPVTRTGDSITQQGSSPDGGWVAVIQDAYARKVDVINRVRCCLVVVVARLLGLRPPLFFPSLAAHRKPT